MSGASMRVGMGYDVHRLSPGRRLVIGGVEIPSESGLDGHSDADVLCHAVTDAILGAAGIPSVLFGPGGAGLHSHEEYVLIEDVCRCRDVLVELVVVLVGLFAVGETVYVATRYAGSPPRINPLAGGAWMTREDWRRSWGPWLRGTALGRLHWQRDHGDHSHGWYDHLQHTTNASHGAPHIVPISCARESRSELSSEPERYDGGWPGATYFRP